MPNMFKQYTIRCLVRLSAIPAVCLYFGRPKEKVSSSTCAATAHNSAHHSPPNMHYVKARLKCYRISVRSSSGAAETTEQESSEQSGEK